MSKSTVDRRREAGLCTGCGGPTEGKKACLECRVRRTVKRHDDDVEKRALAHLQSPDHWGIVTGLLRERYWELRRLRLAGAPLAEQWPVALEVESLTDAIEWYDANIGCDFEVES